MTALLDRRVHRRSTARQNRSSLEWWDGGETRQAPARVRNISRGGILVETEVRPEQGQSVWVRIEEPVPTGWIGGRVVRADGSSLAIAFHEPCPRDFLQAAVMGIGFGNLI